MIKHPCKLMMAIKIGNDFVDINAAILKKTEHIAMPGPRICSRKINNFNNIVHHVNRCRCSSVLLLLVDFRQCTHYTKR